MCVCVSVFLSVCVHVRTCAMAGTSGCAWMSVRACVREREKERKKNGILKFDSMMRTCHISVCLRHWQIIFREMEKDDQRKKIEKIKMTEEEWEELKSI